MEAAVRAPLFANTINHYREAFNAPLSIVESVQQVVAESGLVFDTFAVSGISGMVMGPLLATWLNKYLLIVPQDCGSQYVHRAADYPIGQLGERWVFVDDFVSSGRTRSLVRTAVEKVAPQAVEVATLEYQHGGTWLDDTHYRYTLTLTETGTYGGRWMRDYATEVYP